MSHARNSRKEGIGGGEFLIKETIAIVLRLNMHSSGTVGNGEEGTQSHKTTRGKEEMAKADEHCHLTTSLYFRRLKADRCVFANLEDW